MSTAKPPAPPAGLSIQTADAYTWIGKAGGSWDDLANWRDMASGSAHARVLPGAADSVTIGETAAQPITGTGVSASLALVGSDALAGQFTTGLLNVYGSVTILAGGSLVAQTANITAGGVTVTGSGAQFLVSGATLVNFNLAAQNGAVVQTASLTLGSGGAIAVDAMSVFEIGTAGGAAAGVVTVDAGARMTTNGAAVMVAPVVNNGTILVNSGSFSAAVLSGTGSVQIGAGSTLSLSASTTDSIVFAGSGATLELNSLSSGHFVAIGGTIASLVPGDAILIDYAQNMYVSYAATGTGMGTGTLTVFEGGHAAGSFALLGDYTGDTFLAIGNTIAVIAAPQPGTSPRSPGTATPDHFTWVGPSGGQGGGQGGGGNWGDAHNWTDTSTQAPATVAPGWNNAVTIPAGTGSAGSGRATAVITGRGNAASLTVLSDTALAGGFTTHLLTVGGGSAYPVLDLFAGTQLRATNATVFGTVEITGFNATGVASQLLVTQTLTLGNDGQQYGALVLNHHGLLRTGRLVVTSGNAQTNAAITVDASSTLEIGSAGHAATGAITIDAGARLDNLGGSEELDLFGNVVVNGTLVAGSGTVLISGSTGGTGTLQIATDGILSLGGPVAATTTIAFTGHTGQLFLRPHAGSTALPAIKGTITGFGVGDVIDAPGLQDLAASYRSGTLTLTSGGRTVGSLRLVGDYGSSVFLALPDATGGSEIVVAPTSPGGTAGPGTTPGDSFVWSDLRAPSAGNWGAVGNWDDTSTGSNGAAVAPGQNDAVEIDGPQALGTYLVVTGPGNAASLALVGAVVLDGNFNAAALTVSTAIQANVAAIIAGGTVAAGTLGMDTGQLDIRGQGAVLTITGQALVGSDTGNAALLATIGGTVTAASLSLRNATLAADALSRIEIGTAGGAQTGFITIDAGATLQAAFGSIQSSLIDNGTLAVADGSVATISASVLGTGTMTIGNGSDLSLSGRVAASIGISFIGGSGAELDLSAKAIVAAPVSGFAAGDTLGIFDLANAGAALSFESWGAGGILTVSNGTSATSVTLLGHYVAADFHLGSTLGATATAVTYTGHA